MAYARSCHYNPQGLDLATSVIVPLVLTPIPSTWNHIGPHLKLSLWLGPTCYELTNHRTLAMCTHSDTLYSWYVSLCYRLVSLSLSLSLSLYLSFSHAFKPPENWLWWLSRIHMNFSRSPWNGWEFLKFSKLEIKNLENRTIWKNEEFPEFLEFQKFTGIYNLR